MDSNFYLIDDMPIVEIQGEYYWDSDEEPPKDFEFVDEAVEVNSVPAFRRMVGSGKISKNSYDSEAGGILSDRRDKRVYKEVTKMGEDSNFIIYSNEDEKFYCVRNDCDNCPHKEECSPVVHVEEIKDNQPMIVVSLDVSAQEPTHVTMLSKETAYYSTFRNRLTRELKLNGYIEHIASAYFKFDADKHSLKAEGYWRWLQQFQWNWEVLIEYSDLVEKYKGGDESVYGQLEATTNRFLSEIESSIKSTHEKGIKK